MNCYILIISGQCLNFDKGRESLLIECKEFDKHIPSFELRPFSSFNFFPFVRCFCCCIR